MHSWGWQLTSVVVFWGTKRLGIAKQVWCASSKIMMEIFLFLSRFPMCHVVCALPGFQRNPFFPPSKTWELFWILASPRLWLFSRSFLFLWTVFWEGWMENNQVSLPRVWNIMTSGFPYSQCLTAHDNIIYKFFYNIPVSHINDDYPQTISMVD